MEIERKWLLSNFPDYPEIDKYRVTQAYISFNPEVRVRLYEKWGDTPNKFAALTIKTEGTLERKECETLIDTDFVNQVIQELNLTSTIKILNRYQLEDGHILEVNLVDGEFIYAEVEFDSTDEANAYVFPFPQLVIDEITYNKEYKMKNYTKMKGEKENERLSAE